ncbi:MAG: NADH-quinone oxidoreductase subunit J, partial [Propionibacteriaceae bacterium]|nr:NADH-quinone oxidoreductase subunit J [Propionibacteriaceae bacterium]
MIQDIVFWVCGVCTIVGALGLISLKKPIHAVLCLAFVMVNLAAIYAALDAALLAAAQVIVYTGAILMLFLFVVMLVGVDPTESHRETIKGQRVLAAIAALGMLVLLLLAIGGNIPAETVGLEGANGTDGNVVSLAKAIFGEYVFAFEYISSLMIIAPVGAMVLASHARLLPKKTQRDRAADRMERYKEDGVLPTPHPSAGVLARNNSIATPALLPDGSISAESVSPTMITRNKVVHSQVVAEVTKQRFAELAGEAPPAIIY